MLEFIEPYRGMRKVLPFVLALALAWAGAAAGAPVAPPTSIPAAQTEVITLAQDAVSVRADGEFRLQVAIAVDRPSSYLESRIQVRRPSGRLLYQKTEVRSNVDTGTVTIDYARSLEDLELEPGIYPIEVRVRTQSDEVHEWVATSQLLVHDPDPVRVPVAVVAYVCASPSLGADGRFVLDPSTSTRARDDAREIARSILEHPTRRITLAIPGFLLEEWLRASGGYELATPEGVSEVPETAPVAQEYARTLETIAQALATGRLEMVTVPYAGPDIGALQTADRLHDLDDHLQRGRSAHMSVMGGEPAPVLVSPGGLIPRDALDSLVDLGIEAAVLSPGSLTATGSPSGVFRIGSDSGPVALVTDERASLALRSSEASGLVTSVFERSISNEASAPLIASAAFGPGQAASTQALDAMLSGLTGVPWLEFVTASQAASRPGTSTVALTETIDPIPGAPKGYWDEVSRSRAYSRAFLETVGVNDPEAQLTSDLSLQAQSGTWAGPDLNWGSADRGRSLAAASLRISGAVLDTIELGASEITLSGTGGEVPVSIINSSAKNLILTLRTRSTGLTVAESMVATAQVRPQENFVTVPVDLGQSLSGRLTVEVYAGDVLLDDVTVTVRASFLDRLVLVFGVAVVLVGMLLFIRRRVRTADRADTIRTG